MAIAFFPAMAALGIPKVIFLLGLVGVFVAGIVEFRRRHIGRPAIFINALLLWQIFYSVWASLPFWFQWYLNVGSLVGLIALIAYIPKKKLPTEFYKFCFIFYGSISIIFAVIVSFLIKIPLL